MTLRQGLRVVNESQWSEVRCRAPGILLRKEKRHRLVLGVRLIQQAAAVEIDIGDMHQFSERLNRKVAGVVFIVC
jgi:hypothetical protein